MKKLCRLIAAFSKKSDGAAAVEFVLLLPLFAAILIGGFDLGRYVFLQNELTGAVQEAGRFVMIRGNSSSNPATEDDVITFARERIVFNDVDSVTITVTFRPDNSKGSTVEVRAQASFSALAGLLELSNLNLDATSINLIIN